MRPQHISHALPSFPVYSSAFLSPSELLLCGGGGTSRSGIKNKIRLYRVSEQEIELISEYELESGADTPMSMTVDTPTGTIICGANVSPERLQVDGNVHCRIFSSKDSQIIPTKSIKVMEGGKNDDYQRVTVLSPSSEILAIGTTNNQLHLVHFSSLRRAAPIIPITEGDLFDVSFSATSIAIASSKAVLIYLLHEQADPPQSLTKAKAAKRRKSGKNVKKEEQLESLQLEVTLERPTLPGQGTNTSSFRAVKYHPEDWTKLYTALNSTGTSGRRTTRSCYIVAWNTKTWKPTRTRKVSDSGLTCFDISPHGRYLAYGASDCSIGILDSLTLAPLLRVLNAHELPPTTLRFNPNSTLLISGSADNSLRVVSVPEKFSGQWSYAYLVYLLLLILLAIAVQLYLNHK